MKKAVVTLVVIASTILVATAVFHATGYSSLLQQTAASTLSPFFKRAVPSVWLFFSWHLLAIALAVPAGAFGVRAAARPILFGASVVVAIDFAWVLSIAGLFPGTILLLTASVSLFAAGWLHRPPVSPSQQ